MGSSLLPENLVIWFQRLIAAIFLGGQVLIHIISKPIHRRNTIDQMSAVGPESLLIAMITDRRLANVLK